jgi:hypothetical protein
MNKFVEQAVSDIRRQGFTRIPNAITNEEISIIKKELVEEKIDKYYSESLVKERLFFKREEGNNRQGDAVMVAFDYSDSHLPCLLLNPSNESSKFLRFYNDVVGELTNQKIEPTSRAMLNCQRYFKNSLPVFDHYDGFFSEFEHTKNEKYNEYNFVLKKGLIPRYVMVIVLENENDGYGTYIRKHDSDERIPVENRPGDIIIFDNVNFRHGVPELEKPRMMIGFRNFDHLPFEFSDTLPNDGDSRWAEFPDNVNPGFVRPLSNSEATQFLLNDIKEYKEFRFHKYKNRRAAF